MVGIITFWVIPLVRILFFEKARFTHFWLTYFVYVTRNLSKQFMEKLWIFIHCIDLLVGLFSLGTEEIGPSHIVSGTRDAFRPTAISRKPPHHTHAF